MLVHSVFFKFKPDVTAEQIEGVAEMARGLGKIETVRQLYIGAPAAVPERPVCRNDYELGITVMFDSVEDHNTYQVHPLHTDYVSTNTPLWERVEVFDME